ncbi:protein of unknown function [Pseudorhodobacter antarcticus]|jgi:uncharacterized protein YjiS (DUF1127 family)|uniref:YjiS-like domain-containing protein n=1 Tax=Pseudorhodobacter antarcticus TaxID=1077947 RepID=A0A1H8KXN0_9RHOB|nr:DUF1127 domain-containing protein [Pseudorhodobacter antarcticus]SEN97581.1 protein of unknown function [Pseudorhodobacter antarcticus]
MTYQTLTAQNSLPPLAAVVFAIAMVVLKWEQRQATRRALTRLDAHLLADVGLAGCVAHAEGRKAFWVD